MIFDVKYGCVVLFDLWEFNYKGLDVYLFELDLCIIMS